MKSRAHDDVHEQLRAYESRDVIQSTSARITGREPNAQLSREIASHFTQGRQYLEAAREAGDLVRPLLIYYGVLSLVRALTMYRLHRREAALAQAHGLSAVEWGATLAGGSEHVPELRVRSCRGTFSELLAATQGARAITIFTGPYPSTISIVFRPETRVVESVDADSFTLGDVWSRLPELREEFASSYGGPCHCSPVFAFALGSSVDFGIFRTRDGVPNEADARALLQLDNDTPATIRRYSPIAESYRHEHHLVAADEGWTARVPLSDTDLLAVVRPLRHDGRGVLHAVRPIGSLNLSTLALLFVASYAAGMFVRYHPTRWQDLLRHDRGDRALLLLRRSVSLVEEQLPRLVLENLQFPMPQRPAPVPAPVS